MSGGYNGVNEPPLKLPVKINGKIDEENGVIVLKMTEKDFEHVKELKKLVDNIYGMVCGVNKNET